MAYITAKELVDLTDISEADIESITNLEGIIERAQTELLIRAGKTAFADTDNDYDLIQRALAQLTAYYVRRKNQDYEVAKEELVEYHRLLKIVLRDKNPEEEQYFEPLMQTVTVSDMDD